MRRVYKIFRPIALFIFYFFAVIGAPYKIIAQSQIDSSGIPQATSTFPVEHGFVNLNNGALHLEIPIVNYTQRGNVQIPVTLVYDSNVWKVNDEGLYSVWLSNAQSPQGTTTNGGSYISYLPINQSIKLIQAGWVRCSGVEYGVSIYPGVSWIDNDGTKHIFPATTVLGTCTGADGNNYVDTTTASEYATDGSGYYAVVNNPLAGYYETVNIYDRGGNLVASNCLSENGYNNTVDNQSDFGGVGLSTGPILPVDRNGNSPAYTGSAMQDTLGRTLISDSGVITAAGIGTVEYLDVPVAGGGTARYTINYKTIPVVTSFNVSGIAETTGTMQVISSIILPDDSSYQLEYNEGTYGDLKTMILPHGGTVSYTYATSPVMATYPGSSTTSSTRWIQSHTGSDGVTNFVWQQSNSASQYSQNGTVCGLITNQVTTASANNVYKFSNCNGNILLQEVDHGSATSTQIDAIDLYSYDTSHPCPTIGTAKAYQIGCTGLQWMNITGKTSILPASSSSGQSLTTDIQYGYTNPGSGIPSSIKQWDYYTAAPTSLPDSPPGLPTRETDKTLGYSVNGALFPTLVNYKDSTGSIVSSTIYKYDENQYLSGSAPSTTPNHNNALVIGNRGNLTTITKCCAWNGSSNSVSLTSHIWYDDAGTVTAVQDANGNKTNLAYDPTDTFPITITLPTTGSGSSTVSHIISQSFDQNSGQLSSVTDENGQVTTYSFDQLGRPYQTQFSNAGNPVTLQTTTYPSANETDVAVLQSPGVLLTASSIVDGYGRSVQSIQEGISTETVYDAQGRLYSVSNAHASTPNSTDGKTYYSHDELGRIKSVTMPNTYSTTYTYSQNTVTVTDALSHSRQITSDAFGDAISVLEPDSTGALTLATQYQYNWRGQLTNVTQQGGSVDSTQWRSRSFLYDGVGRLYSQSTPEAGTMIFGYDNNGNLKYTQNQNATNNTTQYNYDTVNRITSATIGGGPTYTYTYDAQDNSGDSYGKGRMTSASNGSNVQTEWQHDPLGRTVLSAYCMPSDCSFSYNVQASYDFQGNTTSLTYPDGRQLQWTYNQLNRPVSETYAQWGSTSVNTPYISNLSYYPGGQLQQATLGNGVKLGATYNPDQNLSSLAYIANGSPIVEKSYTWDKNASNLVSVQDYAAGRTQLYGYDQLDRISLLSDTGTTANACNASLPNISSASESYTIDPWGNLQQSGIYGFTQQIGSNNRVAGAGYVYDTAGNQTQDANGDTYQYRADGLITGSNGATYTYDALGQRVRKDGSSANEYIYYGGQLLAMRNPNTGAWTDRVYGPTGALATVPGTLAGAPTYRVVDHLGSLSYTLDASGNITGASSLLPYGQQAQTNNTTTDNFLFTDHERDTENGSDATLYRHYASTQGRWLSPDPSNGSYSLLDPQSLNRYAYLSNRPMNKTDRLGLDDDDCDCDDCDDNWWDDVWDDIGDIFGFGGGGGGKGGPAPVRNGGIPGISGAETTEPNAGKPTLSMRLYYNGSTGVSTGSWAIIDYSAGPGLDQDGMADFPLAQALFHGGGQPYWGAANKLVTNVGVAYAAAVGGVFAAPLIAEAASGAASTVVGLGARVYGTYLATAAGVGGAVLGKYPEYVSDAESMGMNSFSMPQSVYGAFNYFGHGWTGNQAFLDEVLNTGQNIYLSNGAQSLTGNYLMEIQYLESKGVGLESMTMVGRR